MSLSQGCVNQVGPVYTCRCSVQQGIHFQKSRPVCAHLCLQSQKVRRPLKLSTGASDLKEVGILQSSALGPSRCTFEPSFLSLPSTSRAASPSLRSSTFLRSPSALSSFHTGCRSAFITFCNLVGHTRRLLQGKGPNYFRTITSPGRQSIGWQVDAYTQRQQDRQMKGFNFMAD